MLWQTIFLAAESNAAKFPQNMKLTLIKLGIPRYQRESHEKREVMNLHGLLLVSMVWKI